jgi:phage shock protein A
MALLERVGTLIRANINELIEKAEDPEKLLKQIILDMENQLMQVKTQVAIAIADQHLLEKKQKENDDKVVEWQRKAELAVTKKQDDLARAAIDRSLSSKQMAESFAQQVTDQKSEVENLKSALRKLEQKLSETSNRADLLISQNRRARAVTKAADAGLKLTDAARSTGFDRMKRKVMTNEAISQAKSGLSKEEDLDDRFAQLEKEEEVERLLREMKERRGLLPNHVEA